MSATLGALVIAISTEFSVLLSERFRQERAAGYELAEALDAHLPVDRARRCSRRAITAIAGFGVLIVLQHHDAARLRVRDADRPDRLAVRRAARAARPCSRCPSATGCSPRRARRRAGPVAVGAATGAAGAPGSRERVPTEPSRQARSTASTRTEPRASGRRRHPPAAPPTARRVAAAAGDRHRGATGRTIGIFGLVLVIVFSIYSSPPTASASSRRRPRASGCTTSPRRSPPRPRRRRQPHPAVRARAPRPARAEHRACWRGAGRSCSAFFVTGSSDCKRAGRHAAGGLEASSRRDGAVRGGRRRRRATPTPPRRCARTTGRSRSPTTATVAVGAALRRRDLPDGRARQSRRASSTQRLIGDHWAGTVGARREVPRRSSTGLMTEDELELRAAPGFVERRARATSSRAAARLDDGRRAAGGPARRELVRRLQLLSNRYRGANVVAMRTQPIPHAYRSFFRQIGARSRRRPDPERGGRGRAAAARRVSLERT